MRTLKFIVTGQQITQDPNCDFSGLVPGSEGYLQAKFSFSNEWKDAIKVAAFWSMMGKEFKPQVVDKDGTCVIPSDALKAKNFKIQLIGKNGTLKLTTNKVTVRQNGD